MTSERCKKHERYSCDNSQCTSDNAGRTSINTDGHLGIGLGGGLVLDVTDGSIGIQVGGITIDT